MHILETSLIYVISIGLPFIFLFVMLLFGLYGRRNVIWVLLCLIWGAVGYWGAFFVNTSLLDTGADRTVILTFLAPLVQQILVSLGVFFVLWRERSDNLIDGAIYGWAAGLGYAALENIEYGLAGGLNLAIARSFSTTLVSATASAITGLVMTQFYFRHRSNRAVILHSGLGAAARAATAPSHRVAGGGDPSWPAWSRGRPGCVGWPGARVAVAR